MVSSMAQNEANILDLIKELSYRVKQLEDSANQKNWTDLPDKVAKAEAGIKDLYRILSGDEFSEGLKGKIDQLIKSVSDLAEDRKRQKWSTIGLLAGITLAGGSSIAGLIKLLQITAGLP
jgi:hypothetical protein